jgi:Na+-transporting NADH:ubiquinone oxidoreductase subunit NqrC
VKSVKDEFMKTIKFLLVLLLVAGTVIVIVTLHQKKTEAARIESETKAAVTDLARISAQTAGEMATNVARIATNVAAKTGVLASNAVKKVADVTTNVVDEAKQKLEEPSH